ISGPRMREGRCPRASMGKWCASVGDRAGGGRRFRTMWARTPRAAAGAGLRRGGRARQRSRARPGNRETQGLSVRRLSAAVFVSAAAGLVVALLAAPFAGLVGITAKAGADDFLALPQNLAVGPLIQPS